MHVDKKEKTRPAIWAQFRRPLFGLAVALRMTFQHGFDAASPLPTPRNAARFFSFGKAQKQSAETAR